MKGSEKNLITRTSRKSWDFLILTVSASTVFKVWTDGRWMESDHNSSS